MARKFPIRAFRPLFLLPLSSLAHAADFTWNGGAPVLNNWSAAANWVQPTAPPLSDITTALTFSGGTRTAPNAQVAYTINSILFSGTSASFNLNGSAITFGGTSPSLRNLSANSHIINTPTSWSNGGLIQAQNASLTFTGQISALGGLLTLNAGTTHTIQTGIISGPGSVTISGSGILQNNGAILLGGGLSVSGGNLLLGNSVSAGSFNISGSSSSLDLNGNLATFTSLSGSGGGIDLNGGTLTINQSTNTTTSNPITGAGNFTKTGSGVLSMTGVLTHIGNTTINGGTLRNVNSNSKLSNQSIHNIGANGTLDMNGTLQSIGGLTGSGVIINNNARLSVFVHDRTDVWSGSLSGTGELRKVGGGTLALTTSLSHSGGTIITHGTIAISNSGALGTNAAPTTINSGATLEIRSNLTLSRAKTITLAGAGSGDRGAIRFETTSGTGDAFLESSLALIIENATITHASTQGFLNLGSSANPGTLNLGSFSLGAIALTLNGEGGGDIRIRHALQGTGALIHNRARNLFLQGSSPAFTGPIQVLDGTLRAENANSLGSNTATAPITLAAWASLDLANNITLTTDRPLQLADGSKLSSSSQATWTGSGDITYSGGTPVIETSSSNDALTIAGNGQITGDDELQFNMPNGGIITVNRNIELTGAGSGILKLGFGTLILGGQANYPGTTEIDAGTLQLTASEQLPSTSAIRTRGSVIGGSVIGSALDLNGFTQTTGSILGTGRILLGSGTLKILSDNSASNFSGDISGTGSVEILSSNRRQRFFTANTYTGPTIVRSGGWLDLRSSNAIGPNPALTIEPDGLVSVAPIGAAFVPLRVVSLTGGGTIDLTTATSSLDIDNSTPITWDGNIIGSGFVEKNGINRATFTDTSTYSGETRVREGILEARGGLPNSEVTVDAGASLLAQGTVSGLTISGSLLPGPSPGAVGALTSTGALDVGSGASLLFDIKDWNGSPGTGYDVINCQALNFNSGPASPVNISVVLSASLLNFEEAPRAFKLIRTSSGVIDNFQASSNVVINVANSSLASPEGTWSFRVLDGDLEAVYTPEGFSGYEAWIAGFNLGPLTGPTDDPDNDGIPNLIEFIIGGNPQNVDDSGKLPASSVDDTHIEFVFRRSKASEYLNPAVRHGTDLVGWNTAVHNQNGVTISSEGDPHDPEIDLVTVRIPRDGQPRRFAQLFAILPAVP